MAKQNLEKEVKRNWGKNYTIGKRKEDFRKGRESKTNQSCIAKDHCLSSSLSLGVLLAHSSISWAISLWKFLLLTSLLLKIRLFLIFQRFNRQAAKHMFQTLA
jgi:hypothetical protein